MQQSTRNTMSAFAKAAITDPTERDEVLKLLASKPAPKDKLLKTKAAAALVGCHPKSLFLWAKAGKLHPAHQTARRVRWSLRELEAFTGEALEA